MPPVRDPDYDSPASMPSRATSSFYTTVCTLLHERACDYVLWVAGHGGDADTVRTYLEATRVFPSHFRQWASTLSRDTILASIPVLRTIAPGLTSPLRIGPRPRGEYQPDDNPRSVLLPPVVATIVTLATQQHIMRNGQPSTVMAGGSIGFNLSGVYRPQDHVDLLTTNFGTTTFGTTANGQPSLSGLHAPIIEAAILRDGADDK